MLYRFTLDLAIPETAYNNIPAAKKLVIRDAIRALKVLAVKINEGADNEEMTVKATYHICHNDEGVNHPPCGPEQEI